MQHDAQREHVRTRVGGRAVQQLGGQIRHLAPHHPAVALVDAQRLRRPRQPEVENLHVAVPRDHDVGRRHVAVDNPQRRPIRVGQGVGEVQPPADLATHLSHESRRQMLAGLVDAPPQQRGHVDPLDRLHHQVVAPLLGRELEHLDDVRVDEPRRDVRLVHEHPDELRLPGQPGVDALDDERPLERSRALPDGAEHLRHPATP